MGGAANDTVVLGAAFTATIIDLSGGNDKLTLFNAAANTVTLGNVETLVAGTGSDQITSAP